MQGPIALSTCGDCHVQKPIRARTLAEHSPRLGALNRRTQESVHLTEDTAICADDRKGCELNPLRLRLFLSVALSLNLPLMLTHLLFLCWQAVTLVEVWGVEASKSTNADFNLQGPDLTSCCPEP